MDDPSLGQRLNILLQPMAHQSEVREASEDWAGVTRTDLRRKLQNRLNQRAYRRRRLETCDSAGIVQEGVAAAVVEPYHVPPAEEQVALKMNIVQHLAMQAYSEYQRGIARPEHLPRIVQINVFNAMAQNAMALGQSTAWLLCDAISPFGRIGPCAQTSTSYPNSLYPTALQASTPHHPWIDLLPWPTLRDRILWLIHRELIDEDEMCHDMVEFDTTQGSEKASLIIWGEPWDPRGWEASSAFLFKWGWLLEGCTDILEATNYWRGKRGERKLSFKM